jgi:hypothetical protein
MSRFPPSLFASGGSDVIGWGFCSCDSSIRSYRDTRIALICVSSSLQAFTRPLCSNSPSCVFGKTNRPAMSNVGPRGFFNARSFVSRSASRYTWVATGLLRVAGRGLGRPAPRRAAEAPSQSGVAWSDADVADLAAYRNRMLEQPSARTGWIPSGDMWHPSLGGNGTCFVYLHEGCTFPGQ